MKPFTARGRLRHFDEVDQRLIAMEDGDTMSLRDGLCEFFCLHGWGDAPGCDSVEAKPQHVILSAEGAGNLTEEHAELIVRPD